jgi:probable phosphoglycerate mutase
MARTRIILARHAESVHGIEKTIADLNTCKGLTERGVQQADLLGSYFLGQGYISKKILLISSPVFRAAQTAKQVGRFLGTKRLIFEDGLREIHPGTAEGLTLAEYHEKFGNLDLYAYPDLPFAPGGETLNEFSVRVRNTMDKLVTTYPRRTVLAITHAGFIVVSLIALFKIPRPGNAFFSPSFTGLTVWDHDEDIWTLKHYNHTGNHSI